MPQSHADGLHWREPVPPGPSTRAGRAPPAKAIVATSGPWLVRRSASRTRLLTTGSAEAVSRPRFMARRGLTLIHNW